MLNCLIFASTGQVLGLVAYFNIGDNNNNKEVNNNILKLLIILLVLAFRYLFLGAVLNLAEFLGLRPDGKDTRKILYFHDNQLIYPARKQQDQDFQFGHNQTLLCLGK